MAVEISNNYQIENFESPIVVEKIKGISQAKSFKGWLQGRINIFSNRKNKEVEVVLMQVMEVYDKFHGEELEKVNNFNLELEIISGWKGEGSTEIYKGFDNDFRITQPIKDKTTGIVSKTPHTVEKNHLNRMIRVIKDLPIGEPVSCYEIAKRLGYDWKNDVWKNRTKVYFKQYYFPVKILEKLKVITYSGKGEIVRIV